MYAEHREMVVRKRQREKWHGGLCYVYRYSRFFLPHCSLFLSHADRPPALLSATAGALRTLRGAAILNDSHLQRGPLSLLLQRLVLARTRAR